MAAQRTRTAIVAAMTPEVETLAARLGLRRQRTKRGEPLLYAAGSGTPARLIVVSGVGRRRAAEAVRHVAAAYDPAAWLLVGFCGALREPWAAGDVIEPMRVIDASDGAVYAPTPAAGGGSSAAKAATLVTVDEIVHYAAGKAALADRHDADAVDMETAAMAAACEELGAPWRAVRAVSDAPGETLPPGVETLMKPTGEPNLKAAAWYALTHPQHAGALKQLQANSERAAAALAERVAAMVEGREPQRRRDEETE